MSIFDEIGEAEVLIEWATSHWKLLWAAIDSSEAAYNAWIALLKDDNQKRQAIDPASPDAADTTAALNKASVAAAEELVRQYAPADYVSPSS